MAKVVRKIKKAKAKTHRRVLGGRKGRIAVDRPSGEGLTGKEIKEVLVVIATAVKGGLLPRMSYSHGQTIRFISKETLYLIPKGNVTVGSVANKVRAVLRKAFGQKFAVSTT